jgi:tetratricopeptide (TPR) repeat protein
MKNQLINGICISFIFLIATIHLGCKKQDAFLDKKPDASLAVPTTLSDLSLLLNNETIFNAYDSPGLPSLSTDDVYVTDASYISDGEPVTQNAYIFAKDIYHSTTTYADWSASYQQIYYSNVVLDVLNKIMVTSDQALTYNTLKGEALFFRAYAFYNLVQTFALPYDPATSNTDFGIPLVTSSDINKRYTRGTVQGVYNQIIGDINTASNLLPTTLISVTKPCKLSCTAFLARLYLAIGQYDKAYTYANNCLSQDSVLVDYNTITPHRNSLSFTILPEDIFHTAQTAYSLTLDVQMDSTLYKTYDTNDLRRSYFFRRQSSGIGLRFRGTYDTHNNFYSGLATDEIYLIRAECNARSGNLAVALKDLNNLLKNRYATGKFVSLTANNQIDLLNKILLEREKELFFRGLRWTDLRRLNKESRVKIKVTHFINGVSYTLFPNDPKYALQIPDQEIQLTGIPQNIR